MTRRHSPQLEILTRDFFLAAVLTWIIAAVVDQFVGSIISRSLNTDILDLWVIGSTLLFLLVPRNTSGSRASKPEWIFSGLCSIVLIGLIWLNLGTFSGRVAAGILILAVALVMVLPHMVDEYSNHEDNTV